MPLFGCYLCASRFQRCKVLPVEVSDKWLPPWLWTEAPVPRLSCFEVRCALEHKGLSASLPVCICDTLDETAQSGQVWVHASLALAFESPNGRQACGSAVQYPTVP